MINATYCLAILRSRNNTESISSEFYITFLGSAVHDVKNVSSVFFGCIPKMLRLSV